MATQGVFSSKYPFLNWGVVIWDGVTGSEPPTLAFCAGTLSVPRLALDNPLKSAIGNEGT